MKRCLWIVLLIFVLPTCSAAPAFASTQFPASGTCGPSASYTFDEATGHLEIFGTGKIEFRYFSDEWILAIKSVKINEGITEIEPTTFQHANGIVELSLPESLEVIGSAAFNACYGITSLHIPKNVREIGNTAFYGNRIDDFSIDIDNPYYTYQDGVLYTSDMETAVAFFNEPIETYILAPTTKTIMKCAGGGGPQATSYVLPNGIENLENMCLPSKARHIIVPTTVKKMTSTITSDSGKCTLHFLAPDLEGITISGNMDNVNYDLNWTPYSYSLISLTGEGEYTVQFNVQECNPLTDKRWEIGAQDLSYFQSGAGQDLIDNTLTVPCDSIVTLYSKDAGNNETINVFDLSEIIFPSASDIEYNQRLMDSTLTGGSETVFDTAGTWHWKGKYVFPELGLTFQKVRFTSVDSNRCPAFDVLVPVFTRMPDIKDSEYPTYQKLTYGQPLSAAQLQQAGSIGDIEGSWVWAEPELRLNAGEHTVQAIFTPYDSVGITQTVDLQITVEKAVPQPTIPLGAVLTYGQSLSEAIIQS